MIADIIVILDQFSQEILMILIGLLFITSVIFMWLWFINRRTYHNLKHHIPASVVKSYLDSIIQNSVTLKSSLFRGGGAEIDAQALGQLSSPQVSSGGDSALRDQLNQKMIEISRLQNDLNQARGIQKDLEDKLKNAPAASGGASVDVKPFQDKIKDLEAQLAALKSAAPASGGGDAQLKTELSRITKERDELKEKLREYEIIEDDLANLKRLQQENAQLKKALEAMGGKAPESVSDLPPVPQATAAAPQSPEEQATASMDAFLQASEEAEKLDQNDLDKLMEQVTAEQKAGATTKTAAATPAAEGEKAVEKTPEDLLSEFEKMLG